jgi:hypothetical protein
MQYAADGFRHSGYVPCVGWYPPAAGWLGRQMSSWLGLAMGLRNDKTFSKSDLVRETGG